MANRIATLSAEFSAFKRREDGNYERVLSRGGAQGNSKSTQSMNEALFLELKLKRLKLFNSCATAKGPIGEAARKALAAMNPTTQKAGTPANATN